LTPLRSRSEASRLRHGDHRFPGGAATEPPRAGDAVDQVRRHGGGLPRGPRREPRHRPRGEIPSGPDTTFVTMSVCPRGFAPSRPVSTFTAGHAVTAAPRPARFRLGECYRGDLRPGSPAAGAASWRVIQVPRWIASGTPIAMSVPFGLERRRLGRRAGRCRCGSSIRSSRARRAGDVVPTSASRVPSRAYQTTGQLILAGRCPERASPRVPAQMMLIAVVARVEPSAERDGKYPLLGGQPVTGPGTPDQRPPRPRRKQRRIHSRTRVG